MELVAGGDARAFEAVYDRHGGPAFSLAYRMVGNRVIAEDITQEAFLSIWRSRLRYQADRGTGGAQRVARAAARRLCGARGGGGGGRGRRPAGHGRPPPPPGDVRAALQPWEVTDDDGEGGVARERLILDPAGFYSVVVR